MKETKNSTNTFNKIFGSPAKFILKLIVDIIGISLFTKLLLIFGLSTVPAIIFGIIMYEIMILILGY